MILKRLMPGVVCIALLSACAGGGQGSGTVGKAASIDAAMAEVDAAVLAGQNDKAYALLKNASAAFPTDKKPWLRMAQMRFDATNYGEAIVNSLEALERDPDDTLAHSIAAVSGLRVSSKALADLTRKNNLTGNVRSEAHELAKLLRTSLGEEVLVPGSRPPARKEAPKRVIATPPPSPKAASADPFDALK
jgi:predicted Zn-dependent protease